MSFLAMGTIAATVLVTLSPDLSGNFVATGAADQVEINAAIVYCAAIGGGEVAIGYGGWTLAATVNVPASVLLRGMGWTTILNYNAAGNCITFTGDNAKLRDLKIVIVAGAGAGGTRPNGIYASGLTNLEVNNVWCVGDITEADDGSESRQCGIIFVTVNSSLICNNKVENNIKYGIQLTPGTYNRISNNDCSTSNNGINLAGSSDFNVVTGNICTGNTTSGIVVSGADANTITGNFCEGNTFHGIGVAGNAAYCVFSGNTCVYNTLSGIQMSNVEFNTFTGNACNFNTEYGINAGGADNCFFTGNGCYRNSLSGMNVIGTDWGSVTGNTCNYNVQHGIIINASDHLTVVGNTCTTNDVNNTASFDGIHVMGTSHQNMIHANTCNDNDRYGINIAAGTDIWVKNNQLSGNTTGAFNDGGTGTKTPFINVLAPNPDAFIGTHAVQQMADGIDSIIRFEVPIPREYQETVTAEILLVAGGTGDLRRAIATNWGQFGTAENYNVGTDSIAAGQVAVLVDDMTALDIAAAFTGIASEDWIGVEFTRGASNVADTVGANVYFVGFRMRYV